MNRNFWINLCQPDFFLILWLKPPPGWSTAALQESANTSTAEEFSQLGDGHVSCHECHQSISIQWLSVPCTTTISAQCCSRFYEFLVMMENSFDSWHRWIWHSHQNHQNPTTSVVNGFCILSCRPCPSLCHLPSLRGAAFGHCEADSTLGEARVDLILPRGMLMEENLFFCDTWTCQIDL